MGVQFVLPSLGRIVWFCVVENGETVERPAIITKVHTPGNVASAVDLYVFGGTPEAAFHIATKVGHSRADSGPEPLRYRWPERPDQRT